MTDTYSATDQTLGDFVFVHNLEWSVVVMHCDFDYRLRSWLIRSDCEENNLFKNHLKSRVECMADG